MSLENNIKTLETTGSQPQPTTPQTDVADTSGSSSAGSVFTSDTNQPKASSSGSVFTDAKNQQPKNTNTTTTDVNEKKIKKKKDFTTQEVLDYIHSLNKSLPKDEKIKLIRKHFAIDKQKTEELINNANTQAINDSTKKKLNEQIRKASTEHSNKIFFDAVNEDVLGKLSTPKKIQQTINRNKEQNKVKNDPNKQLVTKDELLSPEWNNRT
ncbi:MAG: hypothetical protein K2F57_00775, partial [Candidatus Gastranaerophilales bacterium]|nr:hypothetical protein [Candidatus Gastranaerophilales bacterium]